MGPGSYFCRDMYFQGIAASGFVMGGIKAVERRKAVDRHCAMLKVCATRSMRAFD